MIPISAQINGAIMPGLIFAVDTLMVGLIAGNALSVIICAAIPLLTGISQHKQLYGILGALITVPPASLAGCFGGLPVAGIVAIVITFIPKPNSKDILSRAEIEREMRKMRGQQ